MDRTSLTVNDEEFERNVEASVSEIAEQNRQVESLETKQANEHLESSPTSPTNGGRPSSDEENAPVAGLLRTIQKPLTTIGKMFSDDAAADEQSSSTTSPKLSPQVHQLPRSSLEIRKRASAQDAEARQASAEEAEARKIHMIEHNNAVENLSHMFPNLDRDLIDDVVKTKQGR